MFSSYLPSDAKERLAEYVYRGEDHSYIYNHMWRPLCRKVVNYLPVWIAPNTITVLGLAFVCFTHALLAFYVPKVTVKDTDFLLRTEARHSDMPFAQEFLPPPPRYIFVLAAVALLLYQLLDNLDGHQARRTGTSSPLGLLMDHGCDALNCVVGSLSVCTAVSAGPCWKTWIMVLNTLIVFFMNTWEEYYRGVLVLPVINGPNEGIFIAIGVYLWTAWVGGPHWWYNNAVEVPASWLPSVLRQPAPQAAVAVEGMVLKTLCPYLTGSNPEENRHPFAAVPFFFNLNCSAAYLADPPQPTRVPFAEDPRVAHHEQVVLGKVWMGHGVLQKTVLRLYGSSEAVLRIRYNTIIIIAVSLMAVATCLGNVFQVYRAIRRTSPEDLQHKTGKGRLSSRFPFLHALSRLMPLLVLTLMGNAWFLTSQEDVFRRHPRIYCWTVGLLFTKLSIHLMLSHLCAAEFFPFRRTFVPFVLFGAHIFLTYMHNLNQLWRRQQRGGAAVSMTGTSVGGGEAPLYHASASRMPPSTTGAYSDYAYDLDEELILFEFFALSVVTFVHLVWNVVRETATVLNVPIFTIPKEKQETLRMAIKKEKEEAAKLKYKKD